MFYFVLRKSIILCEYAFSFWSLVYFYNMVKYVSFYKGMGFKDEEEIIQFVVKDCIQFPDEHLNNSG
jgi:hypothetical protein